MSKKSDAKEVMKKEAITSFYNKWCTALKSKSLLLGQYKDVVQTAKGAEGAARVLFGPDLDVLLSLVFVDAQGSVKGGLFQQAAKLIRIMYEGFKLDSRIPASKVQVCPRFLPVRTCTCLDS